jgi:ribonuclease P protein component
MTVHRLRNSADIRATLASRSVARAATMRVHARRRADDLPARWTVVAGKVVGTAVTRNRAKRRMRAALAVAGLPDATDFVVVAGPDAISAPTGRLHRELRDAVARAARREAERAR